MLKRSFIKEALTQGAQAWGLIFFHKWRSAWDKRDMGAKYFFILSYKMWSSIKTFWPLFDRCSTVVRPLFVRKALRNGTRRSDLLHRCSQVSRSFYRLNRSHQLFTQMTEWKETLHSFTLRKQWFTITLSKSLAISKATPPIFHLLKMSFHMHSFS